MDCVPQAPRVVPDSQRFFRFVTTLRFRPEIELAGGILDDGRRSQPMKVVLELAEEDSNIRRVTIRHDVVIGRGADCNLRISAPEVSRRHCFLRIDRARVAITDLESCNGTWLDGKKTIPGKHYFLEDGMRLAVGPVRFVTRIYDDDDAEALSESVVSRMSQHHNSSLSPNPVSADSTGFAADPAGNDAKMDSSEFHSDVLPNDVTEASSANDSARAPVEVSGVAEAADKKPFDGPDDESAPDDGARALQEFLRRNR